MKKLLLLTLSLFSVGLVTGCSNDAKSTYSDKDDNFKTYEFVKQYDETEQKTLIKALNKSIIDLSTVSLSYENTEENDLKKLVETRKGSGVYYKDSANVDNYIYSATAEHNLSVEENGIKLISNEVTESKIWDTGKDLQANRTVTTKNEKSKTKVTTSKIETSSKKNKETAKQNMLSGISECTAYEDKSGNVFFIKSSEKKEVKYEDYGGEGKKEFVTFTYDQTVFEVQNEKVVKETYYTSQKTNRDPSTNDWYTGLKKVKSTAYTYEFGYDSMASESVKSLNDSIANYVSFDEITGNLYQATVQGESYSAASEALTPGDTPFEQIEPTYLDEDSETFRILEFTVDLVQRETIPDTDPVQYKFDNYAVEFTVKTRTGISDPVTETFKLNPTDALDATAKDIIKVVKGSDNRYYLINNSASTNCSLKFTVKLTATNWEISSIEYTAK